VFLGCCSCQTRAVGTHSLGPWVESRLDFPHRGTGGPRTSTTCRTLQGGLVGGLSMWNVCVPLLVPVPLLPRADLQFLWHGALL
jgi:hypothetical protein